MANKVSSQYFIEKTDLSDSLSFGLPDGLPDGLPNGFLEHLLNDASECLPIDLNCFTYDDAQIGLPCDPLFDDASFDVAPSDVTFDVTSSDVAPSDVASYDVARSDVTFDVTFPTKFCSKERGIYIKYFNDESIHHEIDGNIIMSNYLLDGASDILNKLGISDDMYIINIIYDKKLGGDTQLFVTCSSQRNENSLVTLQSKLQIKTGFVPKTLSDITFVGNVESNYRTTNSWYGCPITSLICSKKKMFSKSNSSLYNKKISCIIYGSRNEVLEALCSLSLGPCLKGLPDKSPISGLVAIRVADIRNIIKAISKNSKREKVFVYSLAGGK